MAGVAALVTTTIAMSCGQSKSNMEGLLGCSLCVPLQDSSVPQLLTHLDSYQFTNFLLFHYPRYCQFILNHCLHCYLSYGPLDINTIHSVRDLERMGSWSHVGSTKEVKFFLDLWGFFEKVVVVFLGQVYTWGGQNSYTPLLIDSLKAYCAIQVKVRSLIACF